MTAPRPIHDEAIAVPSPHQEPAEIAHLVACVRLRAERRLAWLEQGLEERGDDDIDAERQWQADSEVGRAWSARVAAADATLENLPNGRFAAIASLFALTPGQRDLSLGVVAPQLEVSLQALYQSLHGRPWPTQTLIARLFGHGRRPLWEPSGNLAVWDLVQAGDAAPGEPAPLSADPAWSFWLHGEVHCPPDLVGHMWSLQVHPVLPHWPVDEACDDIRRCLGREQPLRLIVEGRRGSGRRSFAAAVAACLGFGALCVDDPPDDVPWPRIWMLVQRQALLSWSLPVWAGAPPAAAMNVAPAMLQIVCIEPGEPVEPDERGVDRRISLPAPDADMQRQVLHRLLPESAAWPACGMRDLLDRPGLTIGDLARLARSGSSGPEDATRQLRHWQAEKLGDLAERLETPFDWDDLVLPAPLKEALIDFAFEARNRHGFWEHQEVRRLFPRGRGLIGLLAGPPGTGKTMAAQIVALDMGVDVFRVDLATVVNKYIGETAKNLKRIFARAADMHALLLFDEADALFANRTEVKDSHDRYANTDTNYLLQLLEGFTGTALLATNRKANIDKGFIRRLRYVYDFPRPDAEARRDLWQRLTPPILGQGAADDLKPMLVTLAEELDLTGAQIKNALLAGHFAARRRGARPELDDLLTGVDRELAKEGRNLSPRERQRWRRHD